MIHHYLKIFSAQFLGNKIYSLINIGGLAAGLTCFMMIMLFVRHELGYDRYHNNADDIYRVSLSVERPDGSVNHFSTNAGPVAPLLMENFQEIETATRIMSQPVVLTRGDLSFMEEGFSLVDENFFSVFKVTWIAGDPELALARPDSVVLTESLAEKYFGSTDPLGEQIRLNSSEVFTVNGVIRDLPSNTHLSGDLFASLQALGLYGRPAEQRLSSWNDLSFHTYIKFTPGADLAAFRNSLPEFISTNAVVPPGLVPSMALTGISDIHMHSEGMNDLSPKGSLGVVAVFSAIAFSILMIASINFMNISTARSSRRAREVGVRKVLGASRSQLFGQFMGEAVLLYTIAMVIAITSVEVLLPVITAYLGVQVELDVFGEPRLFVLLPLVALGLGLLAGWYPALFLSALKPAHVLKGMLDRGDTGRVLRGGLVILQFSAAIVLLAASVVVFSQMQFTSLLDPGFESDNVVVLENIGPWEGFEAFRNSLQASDSVSTIATSRSSPLRDTSARIGSFRIQGDTTERTLPVMQVDASYFPLYRIDVLAGRNFSLATAADRMSVQESGTSGAFIINNAAVREFGWTVDNAIGQFIESDGNSYPVIGVVNNTVESAKQQAGPIIYSMPDAMMAGQTVSVKIGEGSVQAALAVIDAAWDTAMPDRPIQRVFLSDKMNALYQEEIRQMELTFLFSAVAILIACLGLYGLATFNTEIRAKEIGVRKVMGSSVWQIIVLLTNDFSKLVLIANVIAWPVAWYIMNQWLANFAYRIDLTPMIFIGSGLIALCIAWVTVGGTAAKAASQRPVLALRYE